MIDFFWFQLEALNLTQITCLLILLLALGYSARKIFKSLPKKTTAYKITLLSLNILAGLSLAALVTNPKITRVVDDSIALITSNNVAEALLSEIDSDKTYRLVSRNTFFDKPSDSTEEQQFPKANSVQTIQSLPIQVPALKTLKVFGDGLDEKAWQEILANKSKTLSIEFQPSTPRIGFTQVRWTEKINLGEYLHVQGFIHTDDPRVNNVVLLDPAGDQVSEYKLLPNETFSVSSKPKLSGRHAYQLVLKDSKQNELVRELIHIQVQSESNAKMIAIQSSPSFETKQLQNWAAENGASLMMQTKISKDKYITRFTNLEKITQTSINDNLLSQFQLLIMDGRALLDLSPVQTETIRQAVSNGLGLIVIADQALVDAKQNLPDWMASLALSPSNQARELIPYWSDNLDGFTAPIESFIPVMAAEFSSSSLNSNPSTINTKTLVQASNGWPMVKSKPLGMGQVAVSLIRETYRWVTNGDRTSHSHYWQNIIHNLARPSQPEFKLIESSPKSSLRFEGAQQKICIQSNTVVDSVTIVPAKDIDEVVPVNLERSDYRDGHYCGVYWPKSADWYRLNYFDEQDNKSYEEWFAVNASDSWQALQQTIKTRDTLRVQQRLGQENQESNKAISQPINRWIFWWLFVLCAGLIWVENKYLREE